MIQDSKKNILTLNVKVVVAIKPVHL